MYKKLKTNLKKGASSVCSKVDKHVLEPFYDYRHGKMCFFNIFFSFK